MGRKSQKNEFYDLILDELSDINQKKGISFNELFRKIKAKRGKFSFDTLSKYLKEMERDGSIIKIIDINSNKKIKPTYFYKNVEIINLHTEKINLNKILMDNNTQISLFSTKELKNSDLFPKFREVIFNFLEKKMNLNIRHLIQDLFISNETFLENFNLYMVENPKVSPIISNFNDISLLLYLNLLEALSTSEPTLELHYDLFFHIKFSALISSIILDLANIIQRGKYPLDKLFRKKIPPLENFSFDEILNLLLDQFSGEFKEKIKDYIQQKRLDDFSEKYRKGLGIY